MPLLEKKERPNCKLDCYSVIRSSSVGVGTGEREREERKRREKDEMLMRANSVFFLLIFPRIFKISVFLLSH